MAGRPKREEEVTPVLLRISPALLARVERCQALAQLDTGARKTRTAAFEALLTLGCAAVEHQYADLLAPTSVFVSISKISKISKEAPSTTVIEKETPAPADSPAQHAPTTAVDAPQPQEDATPSVDAASTPAPKKKRGRKRGDLSKSIETLIREHPGWSAEQLRGQLDLAPGATIGDTLQNMRNSGVVTIQGSGRATRYFVAQAKDAGASTT